MVREIIHGVTQLMNPTGYIPNQTEWLNAIQSSSIDLYIELRGNLRWNRPNQVLSNVNFQETTTTTDALQEMYKVYGQNGGTDIITITPTDGAVLDRVQILEVQYAENGAYSTPVFYPDNEYGPMKDNLVIPPTQKNPIFRLQGLNTYEIFPKPFYVRSRCLVMPTTPVFTVTDIPGELMPLVTVTTDLNWQPDKTTMLIYRTLKKLGIETASANAQQGADTEASKIL